MKSKKVILFIVEGPSDESALNAIFSKIFDQNTVYVHIVHSDITARNGVSPQTIINEVHQLVKTHMSNYGLRKTDMLKVVHIMDTDGAYVPNTAIKENSKFSKPFYKSCEINTNNPQNIINRNKQKRANMNKLSLKPKINGIPYLAIYMSCNLDHVLFNKVNIRDSDKQKESINFAKKYKNDTSAFLSFIKESDFSVQGTRKETWEYIKINLNSLNRYTNLNILFE